MNEMNLDYVYAGMMFLGFLVYMMRLVAYVQIRDAKKEILDEIKKGK